MNMVWAERAQEFHLEHPEVYREFRRIAASALRRGFRHYSAQTIWTVMRFHSDVDGRDAEPFKLNQNYAPYFSRKLMAEDPRFTGFFETRDRRAA